MSSNAGAPQATYLLTVSARMKDRADGGVIFPKPVTLRLMSEAAV
jgi:hypothetical protein